MTKHRVIIAGSRDITEYDAVADALANAFDSSEFSIDDVSAIDEVVSGRAEGVDTLGEQWADRNGVPVAEFPYTDYESENGKPAPLVRNDAMAEYATSLVAVWNGSSSGTEYMISAAEREGLDVYIHRTDSFRLDQF